MEPSDFVAGKQIAGTVVIDTNGVYWEVLKNIKYATAQPREGQYYTKVIIPEIVEPLAINIDLTSFTIDRTTDKISFKIMAESTSANIQITVTQAGTYKGILQVEANGKITEQAIEHVFKPDPIPADPPVNPYPTVTTLSVVTPVKLPVPEYLVPITDTSFADTMKITKVSNPILFKTTTSPYVIDTGYSKVQPWSRDMTYLRVGNRHLLDGQTYKYIRLLDTTYKLWSNVTDNKMYSFFKTGQVKVYTPSTNTTSASIIDLSVLTGYDPTFPMTAGNFEGNMSADDTRFILMCKQSGVVRNVVVNLITGAIIDNFSNADLGVAADVSDWISVSPSGDYIVTNRGTGYPKMSYTIGGTQVQSDLGEYSHRDVGYDENDNQILTSTSNPVQHNIITGVKTEMVTQATMNNIFGTNTSGGHSSMRASLGDMKGWALISMTSDLATYKEIFWVKTDGSQQVMRVCNARLSAANAKNGPQAAPSWDGKKILFASDWGTGGNVDAYVVEKA